VSREWLEKTLEDSEMRDLPDNLYVLLELAEQLNGGTIRSDNQWEEDKKKPKARADKQKWGPILVEKRPCRGRQDGKTVVEKAQDRKRMANLDGVGGNSKFYNSFLVLSNREITSIASIVGVDLGQNAKDRASSLDKIQQSDADRAKTFRCNCATCQDTESDNMLVTDRVCIDVVRDVVPTTPDQQIKPQMGGDADVQSQWTQIVNRKKSKTRLKQ
jgi:hypothetical protein